MSKKRIFSGIQPSGNIHIGNYLGAIKNWVADQDKYDNTFCIVDLHAITVPQEPKELKRSILDTTKILVSAGITAPIFVQSHIPAHAELTWILNCQTPISWLKRMTQFKEKSEKNPNMGLFDYPVLMAADILLYNTNLVPVGEDQKQHVELARDIAKKFGDLFVVPEALIAKKGARIMDLENPTRKMSKSNSNQNGAIYLTDSPKTIKEKIKKATTDSETKVQKNPGPAINNLLTIYNLFGGKDAEGLPYSEFKEKLSDIIIAGLKPLQDKYNKISDSDIEKILKNGKEKIEPIAKESLTRIRKVIGLG